jgi:predicted AlkP superfamily pyrophosphatase or phosphodiesterase
MSPEASGSNRGAAVLRCWLILAIALASCAAILAPPSTSLGARPTVILLSWDGTRWDYPDRGEFPALERLARDGVRAERLIPVFPASTFPNHVSLATGTYVDRHGIVGNVFDDPKLGHYRYSNDARFIAAEPVWIAAERQGVRAATFFWVGSETDWNGRGATYRKTPFDGDVGEAEKVDQILAWLDLPEPERPGLILSWWHGADGVGHSNGPDDESITTQLAAQDAQLGRLLAGLDARDAWGSTTLLVVSDHGMSEADGAIDVEGPLEAAGIAARLQPGGGYGYLTLNDPGRLDDALALLGEVEGLHAWAADAVPAELRARYPGRTGHITLVAEPPRTLWRAPNVATAAWVWASSLLGGRFGLHGYTPDHPEMHAVFYAAGRGVPPYLDLGAVRTIDVAPTVTRLLGIGPPADAEGRPIDGIGPP